MFSIVNACRAAKSFFCITICFNCDKFNLVLMFLFSHMAMLSFRHLVNCSNSLSLHFNISGVWFNLDQSARLHEWTFCVYEFNWFGIFCIGKIDNGAQNDVIYTDIKKAFKSYSTLKEIASFGHSFRFIGVDSIL